LAEESGIRRKRQIGRPLADLVVPTLGKTLAARGFAAADVVLAWKQIMGERLAAISEPIALEWPRGAKPSESGAEPSKAATLVIRVEGAFGLEIRHLAPVILERVNAYFGWRCADKLVIRQGRVARKAARPPPSSPDAQAREKGRKKAEGVADEGLRRALAELGAEVFARTGAGEASGARGRKGDRGTRS
jgi:hypothetical protein